MYTIYIYIYTTYIYTIHTYSGSDAASMSEAYGEVVEKGGKLGILASFNKRYITLAPIAGVVGLAFMYVLLYSIYCVMYVLYDAYITEYILSDIYIASCYVYCYLLIYTSYHTLHTHLHTSTYIHYTHIYTIPKG